MKTIKINPADNVAVALEPDGGVPFGHKVALSDIPAGAEVLKYGYPIGRATSEIKAGAHVHSHNMKTALSGQLEYVYEPNLTTPPPRPTGSFMGFKRANGKAGIRNEIWIIPTVGCVSAIGEAIAKKAQSLLRGSVQGVYSFAHTYGCSQLGDDHENTKKALCGLVKHPNAGGALVLGLGCENNHIEGMRELLGEVDDDRVKFLVCQEHGDEVAAALELVDKLIAASQNDAREELPTSMLTVGLKCGGSDGFSGITANPLVGAFADMLVAEGGSAILTEVPEMFGAETILMNRCKDEATFRKTVELINGFKDYFISHDQPVYENPSPGNKAGGITTLEDKSLGCTQKAGTSTVEDVLLYGDELRQKGLNLLQGPGNDLVSSTALAVSGAQLVLFTTGRGTPFGSPIPTVKISSNTPLYKRKPGWMDFNAGTLVEGESLKELSDKLYEYVIRLASGEEYSKTEQNGIREIALFKNGVTL